MKNLLPAAIFASLFAGTALAAEVTETVTVNAAPKAVWKLVGGFDAIANWLPGCVSSPDDKGNKIGSVRTITLKAPGNPEVIEKLTARGRYSYSYAIVSVDPKVLPVSGYTSTITLAKAGKGTLVTWKGDFTPAGGADEVAADKAVSGLYRAGLDNIKTLAEK